MSVPWGVWFEPTQPVRRLVELARLGESLGAEMCFVADEGTERDVYVALTAIVEATGLTVAPAITNPFSRHPVATAAAIATLAELAPGRVMHGSASAAAGSSNRWGWTPSVPTPPCARRSSSTGDCWRARRWERHPCRGSTPMSPCPSRLPGGGPECSASRPSTPTA